MNVAPMLCRSATVPTNDPGWLHEQKIDGGRAWVVTNGGRPHIFSRTGRDISAQFPEFQHLCKLTKCPTILDAEIASADSVFNAYQHRISSQNDLKIKMARLQFPMVMQVFDILRTGQEDLMARPLTERKRILSEVLTPDEKVLILPHTDNGVSLFEKFRLLGKEGIVSKRKSSPYQTARRSPDWIKVKAFNEGLFTIYGCTVGEGKRDGVLGALILAQEGRFCGLCGTGFNDTVLSDLTRKLRALEVKATPRLVGLDLSGKDVMFFCRPELMCNVQYLEFSRDGILRFPSFRGLK